MSNSINAPLPTYFVSHGGGPWPWMKDAMPFDMSALEASLQAIPTEIGITPKAALVISGHWEEPEFTVQTNAHPSMIYDFSGFPEHTYHIQYPAPGSPEVAERVTELLNAAGIPIRQDPHRGYDHGVYAPLFAIWPEANVPVVQVSIKDSYDPEEHLALGRALAPLRNENVLIIGSGLSYHNLRAFGPGAEVPSREFDDWLGTALLKSAPEDRAEALRNWASAPSARLAHPTEDHLIPLMVAAGAAENDPAARTYYETTMAGGITVSSYRFGELPNTNR